MWIENGIIPDVIVVDPPRKGCDKTLLDTMLEAKPKRIVYVSCDSSTLARDLKILIDGDITLKSPNLSICSHKQLMLNV